MMFPFVKDPSYVNSQPTDKAIRALESEYHIQFPEILYKYLVAFDGAKINLKNFKVSNYICEVSLIVPICGEGYAFKKIVENDRKDGFIDKSLYPLAMDRGGDLYYWSSKSKQVFLLFADDIENPFIVSDSVENFFNFLIE
ncbi:MAG: hypothetical protein HFE88_08220 [Acutalibacter sp.]|nr:hypothetical protein [Acutalibacter sp.]